MVSQKRYVFYWATLYIVILWHGIRSLLASKTIMMFVIRWWAEWSFLSAFRSVTHC